ncbi:MAG: hypothetical protein AAGI38_12670 [Bacteroidota bacterium]
MRTTFLLTVLIPILSGFFLFGQGPKATVTEPIKLEPAIDVSRTFGFSSKSFYVLKREHATRGTRLKPKPSSFIVDRYSSELELLKSKSFTLNKGLERKFEFIARKGTEMKVFSSTNMGRADQKVFYIEDIHTSSLEITDSPKKIGEFKGQEITSGPSNYTYSKDKNRLLLYHPFSGEDKEAQLFYTVFNEEFTILHQQTVKLPYKYQNFVFEDVQVSNSGMVILFGKLYRKGRNEDKGGKPNYEYVITCFDKGGVEKTYTVNDEEVLVRYPAIGYHESSGKISLAGMYEEKLLEGMRGAFYALIDTKSDKVLTQKSSKYKGEFIFEDMLADQRKKQEPKYKKGKFFPLLSTHYKTQKVISLPNGEALMCAEEHRIYGDEFKDIVVTRFAKDGSIKWSTMIKKYQHPQEGERYASFIPVLNDNNLRLLFSDNSKNDLRKPGERLAPLRTDTSAQLVLVQLDINTGTKSRKVLLKPNLEEKEAEFINPQSVFIRPNQKTLYLVRQYNFWEYIYTKTMNSSTSLSQMVINSAIKNKVKGHFSIARIAFE